jgi:hypothetical protein
MGHSVLPKSTNTARIKENIDLFDWSIPEDLLANFNDIEQASHFIQNLYMDGFQKTYDFFCYCIFITRTVMKTSRIKRKYFYFSGNETNIFIYVD